MIELRNQLYTHAGLENITENIVMEKIQEIVDKKEKYSDAGFCLCWICLSDIAAIVLNQTKPHYCSNYIDKKNRRNGKFTLELKKEISIQILNAMENVKENPHH